MISEAHKQQLQLKYGLPESLVTSLETQEEVFSFSPTEVRNYLGRQDIDSPGFLLRYPGKGAATIRLDTPHQNGDGKPQKYIRRSGEPNSLYVPSGFDLSQAKELWIVEGELKALCGSAHGLPIVGLSGIWNWRTQTELASCLVDGEKLTDEEALLPEIGQACWEGKSVVLLYDSDITPSHQSYDAFPRLAEQLYRLGAEEVRVLTLPSLEKNQKTGLDEFILARGPEQALQDLQAMKVRKEPYLPTKAGAVLYAERLIKSEDLEDKLNATVAYLGAKKKVFAQEWLKEHGIKGETRQALLQEAKERLSQIHNQLNSEVSSSQEDLPGLGPEYAQVKALIRPYVEEYGLDNLGRLGQIEWKPAGNGNYAPVLEHLCNFAAWPIREISKDSGNGTPEKYLELEGLLQGGLPLRPGKIALTDFMEKKSWAAQLWTVGAAIRPYKDQELRYLLQLMAGDIPKTTIYTHLGWRKIGDSWVYLHAGGAVGPGSEAVEVEISDRLKRYSFPQGTGDIKEALKASLSLLELGPKKIAYSLLALDYLAPLCEPLRQAGIEPSLLTYIWGPTGSRKSTLIALHLCHYGIFDSKGLPASFRDTANSIEKQAFLTKDTILPVDDLYPAKEPKERAKLEGVQEHLSRNQGDRTGKGRMKADTSLREGLPPRGLALCSGEVMPLSGSSLARNLVHKLQKGDIDQEKLSQAQAQQTLLSQAMRGYIEWLSPQLDNLPSQLAEAFTQTRKEALKRGKDRHGRLNEAISHLHIGLNALVMFAVSQEVLSREKGEKILKDAWEIFNQIADDQTRLEKAGDPSHKIAEAALELEAQRRIYWADMEDTPVFLDRAVKVGWKDETKGIRYTNLGALFREVAQHLRGQEEFISLSKNDFIEYLRQKELLSERDRDKNQLRDQKTIYISSGAKKEKKRAYAISEAFFSWEAEDE